MKYLNTLRIFSRISYKFLPFAIHVRLRHYVIRIIEIKKHYQVLQFFKFLIKHMMSLFFKIYVLIISKFHQFRLFSKNINIVPQPLNVENINIESFDKEEVSTIDPIIISSNAVKDSCSLVICCAFTDRHHILSCAIQESFQSKHNVDIRWVLCGSTEEDNIFIQHIKRTTSKVDGFICKNNPLGQKWQNCISFAANNYDAHLYAIIGSDDIITAKLIDYIIDQDQEYNLCKNIEKIKPVLYATVNWITFVNDLSNSVSPQIFECTILPSSYFQPIGAGRFFTKPFLEEINFRIFDVKLERLLDDLGYYEVQKRNFPTQLYSIEDGPLISVKGPWSQLNPIKDFFSAQTLMLNEFSFAGHDLIKKTCSPVTYDYLFRQNNVTQQLNLSSLPLGLPEIHG